MAKKSSSRGRGAKEEKKFASVLVKDMHQEGDGRLASGQGNDASITAVSLRATGRRRSGDVTGEICWAGN